MAEASRNWAGNLTFGAAAFFRPRTIEELQEVISASARVKAVGSRHSFSDIADTPGTLVSLEDLDQVLKLDRESRAVTVGAGVRYGQVCRFLELHGLSLHNLASLPHVTVAGACATATHGSGDRNGNLATAVRALELIRADGEKVRLSRERDGGRFLGAVVSLGALGVVTEVSLEVAPAFAVQQEVFEELPASELEASFDAITASEYSVSLFTRWWDARIDQAWLKRRVPEGTSLGRLESFYGASPAAATRHPIEGFPADSCTPQLGVPGPWHERLPHFRMDHTPSAGEELQSEYLVPRERAVAAIRAMFGMGEMLAPVLQVSEIRTIAADDLWMSPCFRQPCVGLHYTWIKDWEAVRRVLTVVEAALAPFGARPHWGKLFAMGSIRLEPLYPRLPDFLELVKEFDPEGKFRNGFLERYFTPSQTS